MQAIRIVPLAQQDADDMSLPLLHGERKSVAHGRTGARGPGWWAHGMCACPGMILPTAPGSTHQARVIAAPESLHAAGHAETAASGGQRMWPAHA